jgi:hypothetical protein
MWTWLTIFNLVAAIYAQVFGHHTDVAILNMLWALFCQQQDIRKP